MIDIIDYYIVMRSRVSLVNLQVLGMDSVIYGAKCTKLEIGWKLELQMVKRALEGYRASARTRDEESCQMTLRALGGYRASARMSNRE